MRTLFVCIVSVALAVCMASAAFAASAEDGTGPLAGAARADGVVAARPSTRTTLLTGFTRARATMDLVTEMAGRVTKVHADVGDTVPENRVFARLDPVFVQLDLENNAVLLQKTESNIEYLTTETKRYRDLVTRESAAQATLDGLEEQLTQARLQLRELQVARKRMQEELTRFTIVAPSGWEVIERFIEPGEWVAMGQKLATLGDFERVVAPFALTPTEYQWLRANEDGLTLTFPDLDNKSIAATLYKVSPAFDPETRKINVELALTPDHYEQRGGLRVELAMETPDQTGAVLVPAAAVQERYDEHWLTRESGEEVRVVVLGPGPAMNGRDTLRVSASSVTPGDRFRLNAGE